MMGGFVLLFLLCVLNTHCYNNNQFVLNDLLDLGERAQVHFRADAFRSVRSRFDSLSRHRISTLRRAPVPLAPLKRPVRPVRPA